jgi:hypothetical protein
MSAKKNNKSNHLKKVLSSNKWNNNPSLDHAYINPNKQKIRGWKRRVRFLNNWGTAILNPPENFFQTNREYVYKRYRMYPWYNFYKHRQPPLWFFNILIEHFVRAYENWEKVFHESKEPYDLYLEIYDPHYILSEIECRKMKDHGDKYFFWPPSAATKSFPFDRFQSRACDLSAFEWELHIEEDFLFESELEDRETTANKLINNGYIKYDSENGIYYAKAIGDVWMGRRKKNK